LPVFVSYQKGSQNFLLIFKALESLILEPWRLFLEAYKLFLEPWSHSGAGHARSLFRASAVAVEAVSGGVEAHDGAVKVHSGARKTQPGCV
jgi:hypothetical protein